MKETDLLPGSFLVLISSIIFPLILLPIEKILPYPFIIEELVKGLFIFFILKLPSKFQLGLTILATFLFSLSENFFYMANFIIDGLDYSAFSQRFLFTTSLHLLTVVIILLPAQKNRFFLFPAMLLAMIIHYAYNCLVLRTF